MATSNVLAQTRDLEPGPWPDAETEQDGCFGLLVLEGMLTRNIDCAGVSSRELLGSGDVLRPWDSDDPHGNPLVESSWTVLEGTKLAWLDRRILQFGARWPEMIEELLRRTIYRSRWLSVRLAIGSVTRVDDRLMLFFWHVAGRWGKVTSEGTVIPFDLTHVVLSELVGAARPSVTSALGELRERGELGQVEDGWLLTGDPPSR